MRARSSTDAARPRPLRRSLRSAAAAGILLAAALAVAACATDPPAVRDVKRETGSLLDDLRRHDDAALRRRATCLLSADGIADARIRRVEPLREIGLAALDSLAIRYDAAHREADSLYAATPDSAGDVESRFQIAREWGRRAATLRAARRAATRSAEAAAAGASAPGRTPRAPSDAALEAARVHVTVRYAGPEVGPDRIDRDVVVRLLRAPGGPWIVYSFDLASDPPGPIPF